MPRESEVVMQDEPESDERMLYVHLVPELRLPMLA